MTSPDICNMDSRPVRKRAMLEYTETPESKRKRMNEPSPAHQGFA